jgi:hypothetical protein
VVVVRVQVARSIRQVSIGVLVGSTVVGQADAAVPPGGLVSVAVPILGPGADVPARIRVWAGDQGSDPPLADESAVTLAAAPPVDVWRAGSGGPPAARRIDVAGDAALVVGAISLELRAGSRRIAAANAMTAADGDRMGVPFGRGRWSASLAVPASVGDGGDARSLIIEIGWPPSAAGPAGSTTAVLAVGDDRGTRP